MKTFTWVLGAAYKCDKWSKFDSLISHLTAYKNQSSMTLEQNLMCAIMCIENCNNELQLKLNFFKEQLLLLNQKRLRYSPDMISWCAKLYFTFPGAYNLLRESKVLTVPHQSYLKKLTSFCNSIYTDNVHTEYLKEKAALLEEHERTVNLLLDEIYVKPMVSYKAGRIIGTSENSNSEATTILAFMISSVLSKNKDIIALYPVRNLTLEILLKFMKQVLEIVHKCQFTILAIISDNNRINRNMFTALCDNDLKPCIPHPFCPGKKLFFMFDSVHLIKSIRNNWLNQANQILHFPSPVDERLCCANFMDLKLLHDSEKHSLVKLAPKLCQKSLFPSNIERQNVNYALNVFHHTNSIAIELNKNKLSKNALDTKLFIEYISTWWKIMNVKHPFSGQRSLDDMLHPIKTLKDKNYNFLQDFSNWIHKWNTLSSLKGKERKDLGIPGKGGMLSKETFCALQLTMESMIEIVKYLFETLSFSYVLPGKFQTDNLEARFGQYRQMSGGNYNISCQQIYESEKKLRIISLISLHSDIKGKFELKHLDFECEEVRNCDIPEYFYEVYNSCSDIDISDDIMQVLIFLAGCVAHKVSFKLNCTVCISLLVRDRTLICECSKKVYDYIKLTDRGALKWPQDLIILITVHTFQIFEKLISEKFESDFLDYPNQKALLCQLTIEKLEFLGVTFENKCSCGIDGISITKKCLSALSNIFNNNYVKLRNDNKCSKGSKRKISTLTNEQNT